MRSIVCCLPVGLALACCLPLEGQVQGGLLVVDRGLPAGAAAAGMRLGKADGAGFIGDHFQVGERGEVWVVDAIRTWAVAGGFDKAVLFGGIEVLPPPPGQPPQPECDCHNLMTIKSGNLNSDAGADVSAASVSGGVWQVDFRNLHWSLPGGVPIQFGVMGVAPGAGRAWYNQAARLGGAHELKAFDEKGKLEGPYMPEGVPVDSGIGMSVQVWAHKTAPVAVRSAGATIEVVLRSDASFDAAKADAASLRFGSKKAAPLGSRLETIEGRAAVVARFRRADTGIEGTAVVSACLWGRLQDGVPFEGCDLVAGK